MESRCERMLRSIYRKLHDETISRRIVLGYRHRRFAIFANICIRSSRLSRSNLRFFLKFLSFKYSVKPLFFLNIYSANKYLSYLAIILAPLVRYHNRWQPKSRICNTIFYAKICYSFRGILSRSRLPFQHSVKPLFFFDTYSANKHLPYFPITFVRHVRYDNRCQPKSRVRNMILYAFLPPKSFTFSFKCTLKRSHSNVA